MLAGIREHRPAGFQLIAKRDHDIVSFTTQAMKGASGAPGDVLFDLASK